jgi:methylated-DNA-protein-cysteine methyltransferase-like protein
MYNPPDPVTFNTLVWLIVKQIPEGCVASYGQIASMIPPPPGVDPDQYRRLGARWVGTAMQACPQGIPWQRVINSAGQISLPRGSAGADEQRALLEIEGILFDEKGRVDFSQAGWAGPEADWLSEQGLLSPGLPGRSFSQPARDDKQLPLF